MTNFDLSLHIFGFLRQVHVETIIVCAGARNAPLVLALQHQNFKVINFFEERSAAFFALGLMKTSKKPVAILTTSGTAVAELLPATIEAAYQGLPLILVTADRPKSYRGTGSPQTIEQVGLFSKYVEACYDLDVHTVRFDFTFNPLKPVHLNVAFDEPLIDKLSMDTIRVDVKTADTSKKISKAVPTPNPFIILGEIDPQYHDQVIDFIVKTKAPVYAEALSHLKHRPEIETYLISSSEQLLKAVFKLQLCESVVRIGGVPTLRFWRDLETEFKDIPVMNFTDLPYSGLARSSGMSGLSKLESRSEFSLNKLMTIKQFDIQLEQSKERLFAKYPLSEQALTFHLSQVTDKTPVYLGNSLPIRNWDQFSRCESQAVYANRGANGIDGQISSYLGWSEEHKTSYCYVGDLTAMYDLAALGLTPHLKSHQRTIVIMNNFGGQIFSRVFKNNDFLNTHKTQFSHWAAMWAWDYTLVTDAESLRAAPSGVNRIIEILPDLKQTELFWKEWDQLCQAI